jgi:hypothetical protein
VVAGSSSDIPSALWPPGLWYPLAAAKAKERDCCKQGPKGAIWLAREDELPIDRRRWIDRLRLVAIEQGIDYRGRGSEH